MTSANSTLRDCASDLDKFCQKVELNKQAICNLQAGMIAEFNAQQQELAAAEHICKEEVSALQCSIQAMQDERCEVQGCQHRTQQELVQLQTKLHQLQLLLQEKERERDEELQRLQRVQGELSSKQQLLADITSHNQERASTAGRGVALFKLHLGLDIRRTASSNTTIFSFTQVLREDPDRVFEVAVSLHGDEYSLASEPPLPRLPHLQDTLNRTNNLAGFLGHARKLFSRMC